MIRLGTSLIGLLAALIACAVEPPQSLVFATTTSVEDSGLLVEILPDFTRETGIEVRVVAVGTGAALRMGQEGNADLLLTHAPSAELELVRQGIVRKRIPIMENHFVIAGPADDPARVSGSGSVASALQRIRAANAPWVSRGDDSGTHRKERALWSAAGFDPDETWDRFTSTGAGMGLSLQVAGERRAYLLSDLGTFLAFRERTGLAALSAPEPALRNEYSLLRLDPERFAGRIQDDAAAALQSYLLREDVQARIGQFGLERFGRPLFVPLLGSGDD